jgi:acyl-CoA synthetase (AMP-forming)/AMP-acid ligase II
MTKIEATIDATLSLRAETQPERLAFAYGSERLTYRELAGSAASLAGVLSELGVRNGDRVALALPAGLPFVRFFYALQRLGAIPCSLNPFAPPDTVVRRAARIRPAFLIAENDELLAAVHGMRALDSRVCLARDAAPLASDPNDVAYLQLTSGTSGEPRAAIVLQRNVAASSNASTRAAGFTRDDVFVCWVPPWHDLGLVRFILGSVYVGASCHLVEPSVRTIPDWLAKISEVRGTITGAPDFAWRLATRLVDPRAVDLSSLRYATNGGEPVRMSTITAFEERFGLRGVIRPGYGLAEATLGVAFTVPGDALVTDERGNVSCGPPRETEVRIADDGEILVRGDMIFAGYFDAEEATHAVLRDGWLHTGDVGHFDARGNLYILGRKRAMLKRGGAVLAPRELEEAAQSVPGVRVAAAVGVKTSDATEQIVVAIEAQHGAANLEAEVAQAIRRALGFAPERVLVMPPRSIPITSNGKIRHAILAEMLSADAVTVP